MDGGGAFSDCAVAHENVLDVFWCAAVERTLPRVKNRDVASSETAQCRAFFPPLVATRKQRETPMRSQSQTTKGSRTFRYRFFGFGWEKAWEQVSLSLVCMCHAVRARSGKNSSGVRITNRFEASFFFCLCNGRRRSYAKPSPVARVTLPSVACRFSLNITHTHRHVKATLRIRPQTEKEMLASTE